MDIKRLVDVSIGGLLLLIIVPLILLIVFISWAYSGRPIFFKQDRPGWQGKPFRLIKFRTMTDKRDAAGRLLPDSERITPLGKLLRSTSLDELPEFWNVLKGDMSIVGPRPLLMEYLPLYNAEQRRRHEVKPGITGWAQINGRNAICWEDKFALDVWYVDNQSLKLDLKIILMTIKKIIAREGISAENQATMDKFRGTSR
jgi:lipopolysaccharide/colanic/teichoic acid biosynthesis glycosyltransferase